MRLVDRHPRLDAATLAQRFVPPPRFHTVSFATYRHDPAFPSQALAAANLEAFATAMTIERQRRSIFTRRRRSSYPESHPGRYLDGGFGVGKTHLLASLWKSAPAPKAYLTFGDLTAFVNFVGMTKAIAAFTNYRLLCIDEFELDDVADTRMVARFLAGIMSDDMRLAVTSNTVPDRLGQERFSAHDFRREIASIAHYFDEVRIDGPDFRRAAGVPPLQKLNDVESHVVTEDVFPDLLAHLRTLHPVNFGALLDGVAGVRVSGLAPLSDQNDALRLVRLIDKVYDARIPALIGGCDVADLFHVSYRSGGYRKKYGRAESRLLAMASESQGHF